MKNKNKKIVFLFILFLFIGCFVLGEKSFASEIIAAWNFPNDPDNAIADNGAENNLDKIISAEGVESVSFDYSGKTTNSARATGWNGEDDGKYWQVEFISVGYKNLTISSKQKSSSTGPRDFVLQYKIGEDGDWINVIEGNILLGDDKFVSGVVNQISLPSDCDNQESVYLRWVKVSDISVNGANVASGGVSNIDDIVIEGELVESDESEDDEEECVKNSADVKINEIYPGPEKDEDEFVELVNFGEACVNLSDWKIVDDANHEYVFPENTIIETGGIIFVKQKLYLNNDTDIVFLFDGSMDENDKDSFIDKIEYENVENGKSYSFNGENWNWTSIQTPGGENEFDEIEEEEYEFEGGNYAIRLNEILPNPKGDEKKGEYIEIYNGESFAINLKDWVLKDLSKTKFTFSKDYEIKSGEYLIVYREVFKFSLNNSSKDAVYLLDPDGNMASSVTYESAKEDISYNFNGLAWNWSKHLTPGKENKFNSAPKVELKKVKSGYVGIPVYFEVKIKSKDEDELKYSWDFDDGGRSYLQNVNHTFKKKGTYKIKLVVDDGGSGVEKDFKIKIKKYPKASVEIARLLPNPEGNDTGEEWLEVKNNSSKEINLKGWKIATGQKNLTNHSIMDDLKIPAGAVFQITRENALFFLNNKEAKIELRYPDGKTAAKISYKKDKIEDGEICVNKGGNCAWILLAEEDEQEELENEEEEEIVDQEEDKEIFESELSKINFSEEFLRENMGKLSKEESELLEKIYEIRLVKNESENSLVVDLKNGKGFVYQLDDSYHFTPSLYQTHWAVEMMDDIKAKISLSLN